MTRLLREAFDEWADEARVPHDLADRALRRRAWKPVGAAVLVMAMIAAVAVFVGGQPESVVRPADALTLPARPFPAPTDVRTDTEHSPPTKLIAAGGYAVSAYYVTSLEPVSDGRKRVRYAWSLYDPRTDGYERTPYAWVNVAPGLQAAAVIEGDLLGNRVGVMDMNTRQILKWFDLEHSVGSVVWSPDGTKLLATAYSSYPDLRRADGPSTQRVPESPRIGYYIIDLQTGESSYHDLPAMKDIEPGEDPRPFNVNGRQDLGWSLDGTMIWEPTATQPDKVFHTLDGQPREAPEGERYAEHSPISGTSPDGRLVLGGDGLPTKITEAATGRVAGQQRVLQLHAWADDDNVIALGCAGKCENEFNAGLVLVSVDGSRTTQLAANRDSNKDGAWRWVLTPR